MSDNKYVDPNSGAAPQPGGFAGYEAAKAGKGFAQGDLEADENLSPAQYDNAPDFGQEKSVSDVAAEAEADQQDSGDEQEQPTGSPEQVLAELDENSDTEAAEPGQEEQAVEDASIEHQGVDFSGGESAFDPSQYGVEEVNSYLAEHPEERDAVLAAEREGKARKGILGE